MNVYTPPKNANLEIKPPKVNKHIQSQKNIYVGTLISSSETIN